VTVPTFLGDDAIRSAIITRLGWIRKQQEKFRSQARQTPREMVNGETVYWLGQRYRLKIEYTDSAPGVTSARVGYLDLRVRAGLTAPQREGVLYEWYRQQLKALVPGLLAKWEPVVGVRAEAWGVKRMKTRWGTCSPEAKRIWLNLELAKKPLVCIEYVVVHELVHLLERSHNARFQALLTQFMPLWRQHRAVLNEAPLAAEGWEC